MSMASIVSRLACVVALGALLAGCDKCGDWWWASTPGAVQVCKPPPAPKPQ